MAKRQRRPAPQGEFHDPLSDYGDEFADPLEEALVRRPISAIQSQPVAKVAPTDCVKAAMRKMDEQEVACLLVIEGDRLVGIFSERDVLDKVAPRFDQVKDQPVRDVMTPDPVVVYETDSPGSAINVMAVSGFRHVPVLDVNDRVVGIISPQRVTAFLREHFAQTA
jgi:CBS domain-containing protein